MVVVVSGVFFLVHLTSGGPEAALIQNPRIGPDEVQRLRERFGLYESLPTQYVHWLLNALRLDFGRSYFYSRPSIEVVVDRLYPTLQLCLCAYAVALLGVPSGVMAAIHRGKTVNSGVRRYAHRPSCRVGPRRSTTTSIDGRE